ncbi:MAG: cyclomaltodextrinase [Thermoleophilia bacterium]|nr:cyclomaltodextrinase [Thermoleophilia bacterium]
MTSIAATSSQVRPARAQGPAAQATPIEAEQPQDARHPQRPTPSRPAPSPAARQAAQGASSLVIPEWVKDAVFYQVFPERFANGDIGNDPQGTQPWGSTPTTEGMMGGDLQGVTQRMGYLTQLGVNALYMNPVFEAPSNHKYNTTSYDRVDSDFGGQAALTEMIDVAHRNGVKVMLDGVFNHVSHQHDWFKDVREKGPKSEYFDRFTVTNWPIKYTRDAEGVLRSDDYKSWWNFATLPVLKTDHPKVREYFLSGKDSVVKKWLTEGKIDGWRMDVADDSNFSADYWRSTRKEVKSTNPNAYLLAENWHDASGMLQGDQFDGAMNYKHFQVPAKEFFAQKNLTSDQFVQRLDNPYSAEARMGMFNLLDSHDTPRFITEAGGDWYRQRPAAIFQMTYVGAPVIYYGDEIAMEGAKDPDSRRGMEWEHVPGNRTKPGDPHDMHPEVRGGDPLTTARNGAEVSRKARAEQMFTLYQKLIETRKAEPALRRGDFQVLATHNADSTLVYRRKVADNARDAIVALNNNVVGKDIRIPTEGVAEDGTRFIDALTGRSFTASNGEILLKDVDGNFGAVLLRDV